MKKLERRQVIAVLIVVIIVTTSFSIYFAYQLFKPVPAYEFKTGVTHPSAINDLIKNGTVVLYFSLNNCPPCREMAPKMADLQSQYEGTNVTFVTANLDNATFRPIGQSYGITYVPQVYVIRGDGAVAMLTPYKNGKNGEVDITTVKSAIEEARNGKPSNIFPF